MSQETLKVYNDKAAELAEYFRGSGSREKQIHDAFERLTIENPRVLELGCGDGRDARVISQFTENYLGVDYSKSMIELAREYVSGRDFVVGDMAEIEFPDSDLIFAFASLLHLEPAQVAQVFQRSHQALSPGGLFVLSTKTGENYESFVKEDKFGKREFHLYSPEFIQELAGSGFEVVSVEDDPKGGTPWFNMILRAVK